MLSLPVPAAWARASFSTFLWLALATYSAVLTWRSYQLRLEGEAILEQTRATFEEQRSALLAAKAAAFSQLGRRDHWPELRVVGPLAVREDGSARVVLVLDEVSCDACQDRETQWANLLASRHGSDAVVAVVGSAHERFAAAYARVNSTGFPVLFDGDRTFAKANDILTLPMLLLLDETNTVVAADVPMTDHSESSEAFHATCERILSVRTRGVAN